MTDIHQARLAASKSFPDQIREAAAERPRQTLTREPTGEHAMPAEILSLIEGELAQGQSTAQEIMAVQRSTEQVSREPTGEHPMPAVQALIQAQLRNGVVVAKAAETRGTSENSGYRSRDFDTFG